MVLVTADERKKEPSPCSDELQEKAAEADENNLNEHIAAKFLCDEFTALDLTWRKSECQGVFVASNKKEHGGSETIYRRFYNFGEL